MKVKIIYRNYRPIHSIFQSMIDFPPRGVEYSASQPIKKLGIFFGLYRRFGNFSPVKKMIKWAQPLLFNSGNTSDIALFHVVDMIIDKSLRHKPYVVDIGHIMALANHSAINRENELEIREYLLDGNCKRILLRSEAAKVTVARFMGADFSKIRNKCLVLYPAIKPVTSRQRVLDKINNMADQTDLKLLFVGKGAINKGLGELLAAMRYVQQSRPHISLSIVSDDASDLVEEYSDIKNVSLYPPNFTNKELVNKFFMNSNLLVVPSHHEIFGMVFLDALSTGTPCVAIRQYSTPEIISDGVDGVLLDASNKPFDNQLYPPRSAFSAEKFRLPEKAVVYGLKKTLEGLYDDRKQLHKLAGATMEKVFHDGRFSVRQRNRLLKEVYEEATA